MIFQGIIASLGFGESFSKDISFLLIFIVFSLAFGMLAGRFRLINILISIYISLAFLWVIPGEILELHDASRVILFISFVIFLTLVDTKLFDIHISGTGSSFFSRLFVMSFLEVGLLLSIIISFFPKETILGYISENIYTYFASPYTRVFWMFAPLLFLFFINKKLSK